MGDRLRGGRVPCQLAPVSGLQRRKLGRCIVENAGTRENEPCATLLRGTIVPIAVLGTAFLSSCSSGPSNVAPTLTSAPNSVQQYFTALDAVFHEAINLAAVDPSSPDGTASVRNAMARLNDLHRPMSLIPVHSRLLKAGKRYGDSVGALQESEAAAATAGPMTEIPAQVRRDLLDVQRAEADVGEVCIDLNQFAKDAGVEFAACNGEGAVRDEACVDYDSSPPFATADTLEDARRIVDDLVGEPLPIPSVVPGWVVQFSARKAIFGRSRAPAAASGTAMRSVTPVPSDVPEKGAGIRLSGEGHEHPQVSIVYGPPPPCAEYAYAEQTIAQGNASAGVRFETYSGSSSGIPSASANASREYVGLRGAFDAATHGVVIALEWDKSAVPDRPEQVRQMIEWVRRVLGATQ